MNSPSPTQFSTGFTKWRAQRSISWRRQFAQTEEIVRNIDWFLQVARSVWDVVKGVIWRVFCPDPYGPPSHTTPQHLKQKALPAPNQSQGLDTTDLKTELRLWNFNMRPANVRTTIPHVSRWADNAKYCATLTSVRKFLSNKSIIPNEGVSPIDEDITKNVNALHHFPGNNFKQSRCPLRT